MPWSWSPNPLNGEGAAAPGELVYRRNASLLPSWPAGQDGSAARALRKFPPGQGPQGHPPCNEILASPAVRGGKAAPGTGSGRGATAPHARVKESRFGRLRIPGRDVKRAPRIRVPCDLILVNA